VQILLVTGPGGAGSSTVAAATALRVAGSGARCALVTTQRPQVDGLAEAVQVDVVTPQPAVEQLWARHADQLAAALPVLAVPPASSVVAVPAAAEFALLAAVAGRAAAGGTDVLVLDAGPLPAATTLLALPAALRWWLTQAAPPRIRLLAGLRAAVVPGRPAGAAALLAGVAGLERLLEDVPLADPARTAAHLVLPAEPRATAQLEGTATAWAVLGQRVASVTVSRVLPATPGEWGARRAQVQEAALDRLRALAGEVRVVAEAAAPPGDVAALRALDAALPVTAGAPPERPLPERDGAEWLLALPLPFARRGEVELTRWADDLVLTAGGQRRSVPLDPLLRRCIVSSGSLRRPGTAEAVLDVRFSPDPAQWPAGLLATEVGRG
jgi:arsenite-transporting ATPase